MDNEKKDKPSESKQDPTQNLGRLIALGWDIVFQLGIPIGLGVWGGLKLDEYMVSNGNFEKNYHLFLVLFMLLGLALGFYTVYKTMTQFFKKTDRQKKEEHQDKDKSS